MNEDQRRGLRTRRRGVSGHTCLMSGQASCSPCMKSEVDLWDAIHRYVISCGGDPGGHAHGNVPRMQAVVAVGNAVRARIGGLKTRIDQLEKRVLDYARLKKLYGESRDYVRTLERERDELERMRPVYEAAKLERGRLPGSAAELRGRGFHPATVDFVEAVERAFAADLDGPLAMTAPTIRAVRDDVQRGYASAAAAIKPWVVHVDRKQFVDKSGRPRRFSTEAAAVAAARRSIT